MIKKDEDGVYDITGLVSVLIWVVNVGFLAFVFHDWVILLFTFWAVLPFCYQIGE